MCFCELIYCILFYYNLLILNTKVLIAVGRFMHNKIKYMLCIVGFRGPSGFTGLQGPAGNAGPVGPLGPQGAQGATGPTGDVGPAGNVGPPGSIGQRGVTGQIGLPGPTGPSGPTGSIGLPGAAGQSGNVGLPGTPGLAGPKGSAGDTGPSGTPGPVGSAGRPGHMSVYVYVCRGVVSVCDRHLKLRLCCVYWTRTKLSRGCSELVCSLVMLTVTEIHLGGKTFRNKRKQAWVFKV